MNADSSLSSTATRAPTRSSGRHVRGRPLGSAPHYAVMHVFRITIVGPRNEKCPVRICEELSGRGQAPTVMPRLWELKPVHVEGTASAQIERPHLYDPTGPGELARPPCDAKRLVRDSGVPTAQANGATGEACRDFHISLRRGHHRDDPDVSPDESALRPSKLSHCVTQG